MSPLTLTASSSCHCLYEVQACVLHSMWFQIRAVRWAARTLALMIGVGLRFVSGSVPRCISVSSALYSHAFSASSKSSGVIEASSIASTASSPARRYSSDPACDNAYSRSPLTPTQFSMQANCGEQRLSKSSTMRSRYAEAPEGNQWRLCRLTDMLARSRRRYVEWAMK